MSTSRYNTIISALNTISRATFELPQALSDQAWENFEDHGGVEGLRPVEPATARIVPEHHEPDQAALPVEDPPGFVPLEEVRAVLADLSRRGFTTQIKELIASFGAKRLSEVAEEDLGALLESAKGLDNHAS